MPRDYVPTREADLKVFTTNFAEQLTAKFAEVGMRSQDAAVFAALNSAWVDAYTTWTTPQTSTKPALEAKNAAKQACIAKMRELAAQIQRFSGTTNALRADFRLVIPKPRSRLPVPTAIPNITVWKRWGNTVVIRLTEPGGRRVFPKGVQGACIYTFVGTHPPTSADQLKDEGQTTRTEVEIAFPGVPAGETVWICAAYYNPRGKLGPGSPMIGTHIAGGGMDVAQGKLRIAA